jgi:hypothetical protein
MTRFLPARIFSVSCSLTVAAQFVSVCVPVPPRVQMDIPKVENDRTRCGEAIGGSKGPFGAEVETGA